MSREITLDVSRARTSVSLYFRHATRHPDNVLMAWHYMPVVPRVGERVVGPFGDWVITEICWRGTSDDMSQFASVDVHVRDREVEP